MRTTIGEIRRLIHESMGRCPSCGGSTKNFGLTQAWECDRCAAGRHGSDTVADILDTLVERYPVERIPDAYTFHDGTTCEGIIDPLNSECIIYRDPHDGRLWTDWGDPIPVDDQGGPDEVIRAWFTTSKLSDGLKDDDD